MFPFGIQKKVFVGLSGGVDSAVSAALLQKQGYDVTGVFIRIALPGYPCSAGADKLEAMRVAAHLRIPFLEIDLSREYEARVFQASMREFAEGRTPNPDTLCNREIKFGPFFEFAKSRGADFIATGHYARRTGDAEAHLLTGADAQKDQSYFLWMVPETALRRTLFPIGSLTKPQVRALAAELGLPNAARKDSQGLCFLGDTAIEDMLQRELRPKTGAVLSESGEVVGSHDGALLYTLGQRHGFTLFAHTPQTPPHFVIGKDIEKNTITVSEERYPKNAALTEITLRDANWIGTVAAGACEARYRYRQKTIPAELMEEGGSYKVILSEPHYVPEGQSLVLYRGERCLGGGSVDMSVLLSA